MRQQLFKKFTPQGGIQEQARIETPAMDVCDLRLNLVSCYRLIPLNGIKLCAGVNRGREHLTWTLTTLLKICPRKAREHGSFFVLDRRDARSRRITSAPGGSTYTWTLC